MNIKDKDHPFLFSVKITLLLFFFTALEQRLRRWYAFLFFGVFLLFLTLVFNANIANILLLRKNSNKKCKTLNMCMFLR